LLLLMPGSMVFVALDDGLHGRPLPPWVATLMVGLMTVCCWRITQVGVLLDGDRIKVRNMFRTRLLRWDDVAEVGGRLNLELVFVLKSGERVSTLVTATTWAGYEVCLPQRQFLRLLTRLEERLAAAGPVATVDGGRD
jgi:hypothetical protein